MERYSPQFVETATAAEIFLNAVENSARCSFGKTQNDTYCAVAMTTVLFSGPFYAVIDIIIFCLNQTSFTPNELVNMGTLCVSSRTVCLPLSGQKWR